MREIKGRKGLLSMAAMVAASLLPACGSDGTGGMPPLVEMVKHADVRFDFCLTKAKPNKTTRWTFTEMIYSNGGNRGPGGISGPICDVGADGNQLRGYMITDLAGMPMKAERVVLVMDNLADGDTGRFPEVMDLMIVDAEWDLVSVGNGLLGMLFRNQPKYHQANKKVGQKDVPVVLKEPVWGSPYEVDLTALYNAWQSGDLPNFGFGLFPHVDDEASRNLKLPERAMNHFVTCGKPGALQDPPDNRPYFKITYWAPAAAAQ